MAKETEINVGDTCIKTKTHGRGGSGGLFGGAYGLAFIGAAVYFISNADTFWMGVLGFLKAIVWPALLIYKVFTMLHM
jgi:hypothetical protein